MENGTSTTALLDQIWALNAIADVTWQMVVMWAIVALLFYLAIYKKFEPLLLVPIAFGALLANLPTEGLINPPEGGGAGGLYYYIAKGVEYEIFPPLIFLGVGALTDFGPLIANPRTLLLGAAAQFGVFATFIGATLIGFSAMQAGAIGIIGGADGPTSIFLANKLAPDLLAPIAVAAYSYMALVPLLQPPIMRVLTTERERRIRMKSLRPVSRLEKLIFALLVTVLVILLVPAASALIGMLMLGNILRESLVTERLAKAAQNELINVVTIFLGTSVGITMTGERFINADTLKILGLGVIAFCVATAAGVLMAKAMNLVSKTKINPLIGSAGVSAVPMAARVSQVEGQRADPGNFLLMHAMGPNVAGVIGTAVVAGYFIASFAP
ncbi:sodium ion-translocating decarboxylase beta subunit [Rhodovulum iodosum]|uniref:oxaloacetate decarboxylase (Na(+) extruding) n=1 Tax=Rhodovulum iodosum TaxID=68291 RepID=A0ABV3XSP0_9RHOB|nr:sodium ion-translocating decarboxylase subunit beta [Rhodovulum robiginosum]RSK30649.1 sodium ion-translocating decarboxylase subunit beta [Rhodovulum robiginosum]